MRIHFRSFVLIVLIFAVAVCVHAQMCGNWTVSVDVVDNKGVPIDKARVAFVGLAEDDVANQRPFKKDDTTAGRFFVTFIEGDRVQTEYDLLINAAGYQGRTSSITISYCHATEHVIGLNPKK